MHISTAMLTSDFVPTVV